MDAKKASAQTLPAVPREGVIKIAENLYIDLDARAFCSFSGGWNHSQSLQDKDFGVLRLLASNRDISLSRELILDRVWKETLTVNDRRVDGSVSELRKLIRQFAPSVDDKKLISTVSGCGYRFNPDCHERFDSLDDVFSAPALAEEPSAASVHHLEEEYLRANRLRDNGQFDRAMDVYRRLETLDHAASINYLGICYCKGEHLPPSIELGIEKYRAAARLEYPPALLNLGDYHMNSELGGYDPEEAFSLFFRAASHPDAPDEDAMYRLYLCFKHGLGTQRDPVEAERWRARAAAHGVREYHNFYQVGLIRLEASPLITGDELFRRVSKTVLCRLIRLSTGEEIRLQDSLSLAGSDPSVCALPLSESPDRRHALIRVHEDHVILTDLHSSQGTFINEKQISPLEEIILQEEDVVSFGSEAFLLAGL